MTDITFHRVAGASELGDGEMRHVEIGERQIALFNLGGDFYATEDMCTHAFAMLSDGFMASEPKR